MTERVIIDFRQPCRVDRAELRFEDAGDVPLDTVKALCRQLGRRPSALSFRPDPKARALRDDQARAFAHASDGQRVARIVGLSAAWLTVAASCLDRRGWAPGHPGDLAL